MRMSPVGPLIAWTEARRRLLAAVRPIDRLERLPVGSAVGRIAARSYRARTPLPPFDRATWDGYALRSRDTALATALAPANLLLVGEVFAEGGYRGRVGPGRAVAIATGGALPEGADTVVRFEETTVTGARLSVPHPVRPGERLARTGEDVAKGALIATAGRMLRPPDLGALSMTGERTVDVWARPIVTIIPNGNELVSPGRPRPSGGIFEGNNASLSALVESLGAIARPVPPVPDDAGRIARAIRRAVAQSDLVLVTGGSSVGERDHLPRLFPTLGRMLFRGIAVRPGRPTLAVRTERAVVVGMPGHPTSCLSNGYWLLRPVLRRLLRSPAPASTVVVRLTETVGLADSEFATVIPLEVRGGRARPTFHDSSAISSLGDANAFAIWPAGRPLPRAGARLQAELLEPPIGASPGGLWGPLDGRRRPGAPRSAA